MSFYNKITSLSSLLYTKQKQESQWFPQSLALLQSTLMKQLFDTNNIALCTRHVHDILLTYSSHHVTTETVHSFINRIHTNFQFNPTHDSNNGINCLEPLTIRNQSNLPTDIYRKPTPTDTTISCLSNHKTEHRTAAYRYHINRRLTEEGRQREWETIQTEALDKLNETNSFLVSDGGSTSRSVSTLLPKHLSVSRLSIRTEIHGMLK